MIEKTSIVPLIKLLGILLLAIFLTHVFRQSYVTINKTNELLMAIASATAIMVAIIVSYLFAKLFAEKEKRIQRKTLIDEYSQKITAFRRIAHFIYSDVKFWNHFSNVKSNCEKANYKDLTMEDYDKNYEKEDETYKNELGSDTVVQAYLAIRDLQSSERSSFEFYRSFKLRNYTINELILYKDACNRFSYFLREKKNDVLNFWNINELKQNYLFITQKNIEVDNLIEPIREIFGDFEAKLLHECYYLTKLNETKLPNEFINIIVNLTILYCFY